MIATLDDVIEQLADEIGIYGAHAEEFPDSQCECRVCWTMHLRGRIVAAVDIERKLGTLEIG